MDNIYVYKQPKTNIMVPVFKLGIYVSSRVFYNKIINLLLQRPSSCTGSESIVFCEIILERYVLLKQAMSLAKDDTVENLLYLNNLSRLT